MKLKTNHFLAMRGSTTINRKNNRNYKVRTHRERFFFPDEWMAFYDQLKTKQKITFNTLLNTGARIMEVQNIQVQDIDFERNNIVLRITKRVVNNPRKQKKGIRRIRVVSVSSKFIRFLKQVIKDYDLKSDDFLPILSTPAANIAMKKALQNADISDWDMFSLHNVRKTAEMWLLALDIDSFKVIKQFGHSSAVALKHYLSADVFTWEEKQMIRNILGDIYQR